MSESPLKQLLELGQSPWLDFIDRKLLRSGDLERMVERWGLRGLTSNPTIFEKAIAHSQDYDEQIAELVRASRSTAEIYEALVVEDIRAAADVLASVYERSQGQDGFVSLEVSPHLVRDTEGTVAEARRLWRRVERPNLMIKVPGTAEGLPAITTLLAEGVNVNVTLLFSLDRYEEVVDAYLQGLEVALAAGRGLERTASVASFFLSRIDSLVDPVLDEIATGAGAAGETARGLKGEVAIACARRAYAAFREAFGGERFRRLAAHGATPQRLLWASTGTKNAEYSDVKYVEPLIGPQTVNTMPLATLEAYHDHGEPAVRLTDDGGAAEVLDTLARLGVDLDDVTRRLLEEGITKFIEPFDALQDALEEKRG